MIRRPAVAVGLAVAALALCVPGRAGAQAVAAARASQKPAAVGTRWVVDPVHSQVDFRIRHLVGRVRGTFTNWYGVVVTKDKDWTHGTVNVQVQTKSIETGNGYRDADLRSPRFFHSDSFPAMTFESTGIVATDSTVELGGILTIKGKAKHVTLTGQYRGIGKDREGHERIAFDATTMVDRRDFGIGWSDLMDQVTDIGTDVEITIALEAVRVS